MPDQLDRQDRFAGVLTGVLAGDALGAPYETWTREDVALDLASRGGLTLFDYPDPWNKDGVFPAGRPTDDSDHTAALAASICRKEGINIPDIYCSLRRVVYEEQSLLWDGKAVGAGKTTKRMLAPETWEESEALGSDGAFPSNGSLMRSSPLALYFGARNFVHVNAIRDVSAITHRHELAIQCCIAYVLILVAMLEARDVSDGIVIAREHVHEPDLCALLEDPFRAPADPEKWPGRGAALLTLHVALHAVLTTTNFRDGITTCVSIGGDTDTYAAVAGGLLGAKYGYYGIPYEWTSGLIGIEAMKDLAGQLLDEFDIRRWTV